MAIAWVFARGIVPPPPFGALENRRWPALDLFRLSKPDIIYYLELSVRLTKQEPPFCGDVGQGVGGGLIYPNVRFRGSLISRT